ncbi:MAG: hypothetical protein V3V08_24325 [Nannocystaceae bacterium]
MNDATGHETADTDHATLREARVRDRKSHLTHEASIRTLGSLYLLNFAMVPLLIFAFVSARGEVATGDLADVLAPLPVVVLLGALGMMYAILGVHLRRLTPKARLPAACMSAFGLFAFPLGTMVSVYFLVLLLGKKGRHVMSREYAAVRRATPEITPRTPARLWILLGLLVALVSLVAIVG